METIKSSDEISDLFTSGKWLKTPFISLIVRSRTDCNSHKHDQQHGLQGRVAFIAGKKHGNAVWRNRAKRRMRAICRDLGGPWNGYDVIFVAKSNVDQPSYSKVLKACDKCISSLVCDGREESNG